MLFNSKKNSSQRPTSGRVSRFRSNYFQQRIRTARSFRRRPKIMPEARTNVSLAVFSRRGRIIWISLLTVFFVMLGYFLFSNKFIVKNINIEGGDILPEETVKTWLSELDANRAYKLLAGNHILAINRARLAEILRSKSQYFKEVVNIEKKLPDTVSINIQERVPALIWQKQENYFLIDNEGFVLEQVPVGFVNSTSTRETYASVIDENLKAEIVVGSYFEQNVAIFLVNLATAWKKNIEYDIEAVRVGSDSVIDIIVETDIGFTAYLDANGDVSYQTEILSRILRQVLRENKITDLAYVDVRLPAVAYYCYAGEPCGAVETNQEEP